MFSQPSFAQFLAPIRNLQVHFSNTLASLGGEQDESTREERLRGFLQQKKEDAKAYEESIGGAVDDAHVSHNNVYETLPRQADAYTLQQKKKDTKAYEESIGGAADDAHDSHNDVYETLQRRAVALTSRLKLMSERLRVFELQLKSLNATESETKS